MDRIKQIDIIKIKDGQEQETSDSVIIEKPLEIFVNYRFYAALMCTPGEEKELAVGFLFSEGVISSVDCIKDIKERDDNKIYIVLKIESVIKLDGKRVLTSGCAKGSMQLNLFEGNEAIFIEGKCRFAALDILRFMKEFNNKSDLFKNTGGVHSCAICSSSGILTFSEDIGRHNALDKVIGKALIRNMDLDDKLVMTTGRISSDMVIKSAKAGIPIIVSHSAPADLALDLAMTANMTVIGFVRGSRMNIYCGENRIVLP